MRQSIRGKIEDWHADHKEEIILEQLEHASKFRMFLHRMRMHGGVFMTNSLLIAYALGWFWMLNTGIDQLMDYHVLLAPAILAALNVSSPPIIKAITNFEQRAKAIDVMETCVKRIFRVKVVQLLTIYYTIFQIMARTYGSQAIDEVSGGNSTGKNKGVLDQLLFGKDANLNMTGTEVSTQATCSSHRHPQTHRQCSPARSPACSPAPLSGRPLSLRVVPRASLTDCLWMQCPEARSGAIFMHQLIMDAVVFISIQYGAI